MAKDYVHPVRNGPTQSSWYGKISKDMDIDEALNELAEKRHQYSEAMCALGRCVSGADGSNVYQQLQIYRKYTPQLVKAFRVVDALANYFASQMEILEEKSVASKNKKWTAEEDETVIDMICSGCTELEIAIKTGRTIGAVHTRVSKLVGVSRERNIEGEFTGTIGGDSVTGYINGKIKKAGK